jgi:tetratricopeptide (TPR) repeat protein
LESQPPAEISPSPERFALPPFLEESPPAVEPPPPVSSEAPPGHEQETTLVERDDGKIEVEFYLENGFIDEARQTITRLEAKFPGNSVVAALRDQLDEHLSKASPADAPGVVAPTDESGAADSTPEIGLTDQAPPHEPPVDTPPAEPAIASEPPAEADVPPAVQEPEPALAATIPVSVPEPEPALAASIPVSAPEPEPVIESAPPPSAIEPDAPLLDPAVDLAAAPGAEAHGGADLFDDLAGHLDSTLDGLVTSASASPAAPAPTADPSHGASQLSGLLAEMEDFDAASNRDDPETHYNLGVAFREMGLLDESIGEFQKVVRGAGKGKYPSNYLQACSLLAICFMEKRMPALAVRWYKRALETPDLDEEALMALQYDLGVAYEQAGDCRNALERFTEVYSQNIDFRDVAEKIRELQQKV